MDQDALGGLRAGQSSAAAGGAIEYRPGVVLVAFHDSIGNMEKQAIVRDASRYLEMETPSESPYFEKAGIAAEGVNQGLTVEQAIAILKKDPRVRIAEPDYIVHTRTIFQTTLSSHTCGGCAIRGKISMGIPGVSLARTSQL